MTDFTGAVLVAWLAMSAVTAILIGIELVQRPRELALQGHERDLDPKEDGVRHPHTRGMHCADPDTVGTGSGRILAGGRVPGLADANG